MTVHTDQIHLHVKKFQAAIATMAWGIAEEILEAQRKRLISGLTVVAIKANTKSYFTKTPHRVTQAVSLLDSKKGTWDRGGGPYKVIGPGKEPETFDLENVTTGKKINATLKTLAFRWKHIP